MLSGHLNGMRKFDIDVRNWVVGSGPGCGWPGGIGEGITSIDSSVTGGGAIGATGGPTQIWQLPHWHTVIANSFHPIIGSNVAISLRNLPPNCQPPILPLLNPHSA
jgi:hypothetical protein